MSVGTVLKETVSTLSLKDVLITHNIVQRCEDEESEGSALNHHSGTQHVALQFLEPVFSIFSLPMEAHHRGFQGGFLGPELVVVYTPSAVIPLTGIQSYDPI